MILREFCIQVYNTLDRMYNKYVYKKITSAKFKKNEGEKYGKEIAYIEKLGGLTVFPFVPRTKNNPYENVRIEFDDKKKLNYAVLRNGKRCYGKRNQTVEEIKGNIINLEFEQDLNSPHRYYMDDFRPVEGGIFCDIGAAEAKEALEILDIVDEEFIFECDPEWIEALTNSFEDHMDKTHIYNKFVSCETNESKNTIALDEIITDYRKPLFIKIDAEGEELNVLQGMQKLLQKHQDVKVAVAVYHTDKGAEQCKKYLEKLDFQCEYSDGYMLFYYDKFWNFRSPYFRRGVIRATKKSGDKEQ